MGDGGIDLCFERQCWHCKGRGYQWPLDDEPDESKRTICAVCRGHKAIPTGLGRMVLRLIEHNPNGMADVWLGHARSVDPAPGSRREG